MAKRPLHPKDPAHAPGHRHLPEAPDAGKGPKVKIQDESARNQAAEDDLIARREVKQRPAIRQKN